MLERLNAIAVAAIRMPPRLRNLAGVTALGAMFALSSGPAAHADTCRQRNFVDGLALELRTMDSIRATSSDGKTYDHIESADFQAAFDINLCYPGALDAFILHLGACTGHRSGCDSKPVMHMEFPSARDLRTTRAFSFAVPPDSDAGKRLIDACNANAGDVSAAFPFGMAVDVTLGVDTRRDTSSIGGASGGGGWAGGTAHGVVSPSDSRPLDEYSKTK
jgi:hypothetical protein